LIARQNDLQFFCRRWWNNLREYESLRRGQALKQAEPIPISLNRRAAWANQKIRTWLRWPYWPLVGVMLLAAGLRLWKLDVLPPGLYHDEAINGVDAHLVASGAGLPLYFAANNGREPLFIYLQSLAVAILGPNPYTLRLVSALIGILTVPAVYFCAMAFLNSSAPADLEPRAPIRQRRGLALVAAAGLAVSYWHLSLSRLGFRAVMLPFVSALAMGFFWRAWSGRRYRDYFWAGIWFAVALYTYTAARLLPLVPLVFLLLEGVTDLWRARRADGAARQALWLIWRRRLTGLALLISIGALLLLPLAMAAVRDPNTVLGRSGQVSIFDASPQMGLPDTSWERLLHNITLVLRNFYDRGDQELRHNLPGRPALDPLLAALFTLGWLTALWQIRQARYRLLLIWLTIMLLPTLLSTQAPHTLRGAGALPPLVLLCAVGAQSLLGASSRVIGPRAGVAALLSILIVVSGALTVRDYFTRWAVSPELGDVFSLEMQLAADTAARWLADPADSRPILLSKHLFTQPQMVAALGILPETPPVQAAAPDPAAAIRFLLERSFDPRQPMFLVWRGDNGPVSAALDPLSPSEAQTMSQMLAQPAAVQTIVASNQQPGWPGIFAGVLPESVQLQPRRIANPLDVRFANGAHLIGYDVQPDTSAGAAPAEFQVTLFWEVDEHTDRRAALNSRAFVNLTDGNAVWLPDNRPFVEDYLLLWTQGRRVFQDVRVLRAPPDMPPGKAYFEVGLFRSGLASAAGGQDRVDIVDQRGQAVGDRVDLGAVMIGMPPAQADLSGLRPLGARFEERIELAGWQAAADPAQPSSLQVDLGWRALGRSVTDYTAFVHMLDGDGRILAQHDQPPGGTDNPTTRWVPGETVRTTMRLDLPAGVDPAGLRLRVGLYEPVSGRQLAVTAPADAAADASAGTYLILQPGR